MDTSEDMAAAREKRYRVDDLHAALVLIDVVAIEGAQSRVPGSKANRHAGNASPLSGVDAAIFAWRVDRRSRAPGQELTAGEARTYGARVQFAEGH